MLWPTFPNSKLKSISFSILPSQCNVGVIATDPFINVSSHNAIDALSLYVSPITSLHDTSSAISGSNSILFSHKLIFTLFPIDAFSL